MNTITFANSRQAAIFEHEIKGQISDGAWENSANTDWETWCDAKVQVGYKIGRNFKPRRVRFDLVNELIEHVGDRMRRYAVIASKYGIEIAGQLGNYAVIDEATGKWRLPTYQGEYYDGVRNMICRHDPEEFKAYMDAADLLYGEPELIADLKAIEKAMRTQL
jgi:hypothetical protein